MLNDSLRSMKHIHSLSFGEGLSTPVPALRRSMLVRPRIASLPSRSHCVLKCKQVVPPEDADPGFGRFVLAKSNHLNICKPRDKNDVIYSELIKFIEQLSQPVPQSSAASTSSAQPATAPSTAKPAA